MSACEKQFSLGNADFGERLQNGQQAAKNGEGADISFLNGEEDDRMEDTLQECPPAGINLKNPQATQDVCEDEQFEENDTETMKAQLKEKFGTLNAMTYRLKELWAKKSMMGEIPSPFDMLDNMVASIDNQEDGKQKVYDAEVFNAICALFEETRKNDGLRKFVAEVFATQDNYYEKKAMKRSHTMELHILQEIYNEKELEQELARLKERQSAKMEAIKAKGAFKAQQQVEKEVGVKMIGLRLRGGGDGESTACVAILA
eukprot:7390077-Prymnesium_polylepis.2